MAVANKQGQVLDAYGRGWHEPEEIADMRSPWKEAAYNTEGMYTGGTTKGTHHWAGTSGYIPEGKGDTRFKNPAGAYALLGGALAPAMGYISLLGALLPVLNEIKSRVKSGSVSFR